MTEGGCEPFLLWSGSREYLNGRPDRLPQWLCHCGRFAPALSWRSPWPGAVLAGLCALFLVACASSAAAEAAPGWFVSVASVAGAAGAVNAVQSWRGLQWRTAALTAGRLIEGAVTQVSGRTVTFTGSREEGTGEPSAFYIVMVEYEFRDPGGERLWGSEEAVRDDLDGGLTLPPAGWPVLVLYLDDHRFVML